VHLGIDLSAIKTKATLQDAMIFAMKHSKKTPEIDIKKLTEDFSEKDI
jgi:hypothetical protein